MTALRRQVQAVQLAVFGGPLPQQQRIERTAAQDLFCRPQRIALLAGLDPQQARDVATALLPGRGLGYMRRAHQRHRTFSLQQGGLQQLPFPASRVRQQDFHQGATRPAASRQLRREFRPAGCHAGWLARQPLSTTPHIRMRQHGRRQGFLSGTGNKGVHRNGIRARR